MDVAFREAEASAEEYANIHLQLGNETRTLQVPIPTGKRPLTALFPAARAMAHEIINFAVEKAEQEGRKVSCCAGCGACCRQLVVISLAEAAALAELVAQMAPERKAVVRQRFADAVARLEAAGILDVQEPRGARHFIQPLNPSTLPLAVRYFRLQIACPFLEDESCSIHPERPLVCREYLVTSPAERCARLYQEPIETVQLPVHLGEAMVQTTHRITQTPVEAIPLVLALEWAEHHAGFLDAEAEGIVMLQTLVEETQKAGAPT